MTKATFTYGTGKDTQIKGKSENLTYVSLPHNAQGKEWLTKLKAYTDSRYDIWGGRDERGESLRCFMVFNNDDSTEANPIGYVNIGVNGFEVSTIEFGITFDPNVSEKFVTEAAISVLKDYVIQTRDKEGRLVEFKEVFGTLSPSPTNPLTDKLLGNGELIKAGFNISDKYDEFTKVFTKEGTFPRFKEGDQGELLEKFGENKYDSKVFFSFDLPKVELAGHTESIDPFE